jgi:chitinase
MSPATTRISLTRVAGVALATLAVVAAVVVAERPFLTPADASTASAFSPYVDVTVTPQYQFQTPHDQYQQNVTLAFVVASTQRPCEPSWGASYSLAEADDALQLERRIAQLRATGGQVQISFGGQANHELADVCTEPASLEAAYRSVVDRYDVSTIDVDIEGPSLSDRTAQTRRAQAVASLQHSRPADHRLAVWLTLPLAQSGLTDEGRAAVAAMLGAGVDLAGVNGMAFDFGSVSGDGTAATVTAATTSLHAQVRGLYADAGVTLDDREAWARTGLTVMAGQSDVATERFTIADAASVNAFAGSVHIGQLSMWSLNRDSTCQYPLPDVLVVVQTSCSGVDQQGQSFAEVLGQGLQAPARGLVPTDSPTTSPSPNATVTDDPATSPFPVWDPLTIYVARMKVVWKHEVYQAAFYSTGVEPAAGSASGSGDPWRLLGPVLPGETPAPSPSLPAGTYPEWSGTTAYAGGDRVLVGTTPFVARYWTKGDRPGAPMIGGSPWTVIGPTQP